MTYKSCVIYYSAKGNTKAIVNVFGNSGYDVYKVSEINTIDFNQYSTVIIATSTWGRGEPPKQFYVARSVLMKLYGKRIGLFGSGNSHYEYFCGALDLLQQMLEVKNEIIFKYKYEGYPKQVDFDNIKEIMEGI